MATVFVPDVASDSTPTIAAGRWIAADAPTTVIETWTSPDGSTSVTMTMPALYPCRCVKPCADRGAKICPCTGRRDFENTPQTCCAYRGTSGSSIVMSAKPATLVPRFVAPLQYELDVPRFRAPLQLGRDIVRRPLFVAPIDVEARPIAFCAPITVLQAEERQSRRPHGPNEGDCRTCGELVAEQLWAQGIQWHIGC